MPVWQPFFIDHIHFLCAGVQQAIRYEQTAYNGIYASSSTHLNADSIESLL